MNLQMEQSSRSGSEHADVEVEAFKFSQTRNEKLGVGQYPGKTTEPQNPLFNFSLDDARIVPGWRKPFDVLAEGLVSDDRLSDGI